MRTKYPPSIIEEVNSLTLNVIKLQQDMEDIKQTIRNIIELLDKDHKQIEEWRKKFDGGE